MLQSKRRPPRVKYKLLQDAKEKGWLAFPNLKLYFEACCLVWIKDWMTLKNERLLELEGHELRFGWHSYLWYEKLEVNALFKNHFVRYAILRVWNKYKIKLFPKLPVWVSFRRERIVKQPWLTYVDLLIYDD